MALTLGEGSGCGVEGYRLRTCRRPEPAQNVAVDYFVTVTFTYPFVQQQWN
jgi:hypothetical protein